MSAVSLGVVDRMCVDFVVVVVPQPNACKLGLDVMSAFGMTIDFFNQTITLCKNASTVPHARTFPIYNYALLLTQLKIDKDRLVSIDKLPSAEESYNEEYGLQSHNS